MTGPNLCSDAASLQEDPWGIAPPAYRLPRAAHIGRVRLQIADLARSLAFYEQVLGMRVLDRPHSTVAVLGAQGDDTPLVELHERPNARPVPRRRHLGLYHFAILLPERAALGRFVTHLARLGVRAAMSDHFVSEAVYLDDPDGLGIEVYADRPRTAWRHDARQLYMTTEPLDVGDLVGAAAGQPWTGMPAGSRIGHVHLHVADIATSASFYHDALGFDKVVWSYPGALFLSAGGYHHHLGTNVWAAREPRAAEGDARLLDWELVLPTSADAGAARDSLVGAGYEVTAERSGWIARDPSGMAMRLIGADSV